MSGLERYTEDDLKAELERRAKATLPPPEPLETPDFSILHTTVIEGVKRTIADGYQDKNFAAYVYEAALTAVYGNAYWKWRSQQRW